MAILSKIKSHSDVINYFKELPFYNNPIERPVKCLKNIDPLVEFPFYEQLSTIKTDQAFNPHMHKLGPRGPTHYIFGS